MGDYEVEFDLFVGIFLYGAADRKNFMISVAIS